MIIEAYHESGLCNKIPTIKKCLSVCGDVLEDNSVYVELLIKTDINISPNILYDQIRNEGNRIITFNKFFEDTYNIGCILPPEKSSVIRDIKRMRFILFFPIPIQKGKEIISGLIYKTSFKRYFHNLRKKGDIEYKIKKIIKVDGVRELSHMNFPKLHAYEIPLTNMQKKIITTAYEYGYYSFPRKVDVKRIAKIVDLSTSTVWEHLRKAESKIMKSIFDNDF